MASAPYIELVSCCDPSIILNFKPSNILESSVYQYTGLTENGLVTNSCYTITQRTGTISFVIGLPEVNIINLIDIDTCDNPLCSCITPCYTLYACDGSYFNTTTDFSANIGTYIRIEDDLNTWYVIENLNNKSCNNPIDVVLDTESPITECVLTCYQVTGTPASVTYMDANYEIITVIGAVKVCSYITPIVTGAGSGFVVELGLCVDGVCPDICFEFTNCQTGQVLVVSNTPSIIPYYAQDQVVTLQGYDGCWTIDISEVCECPVSVTILKAFNGKDCSVCLPIVNYKFTNCNNQSIIKYSTGDYSAYVGKTVKLECGECWFVSEIDYVPPSTQPINITFTYDSCVACAKTYYKLTNCLDDTEIIYTDSVLNLSTPQQSTFEITSNIDSTDCECISITYTLVGGEPVTIVLNSEGQSNGKNAYNYNIGINLWFLSWYDEGDGFEWRANKEGFPSQATLSDDTSCPFGTYTLEVDSIFSNFIVAPCASSGCTNQFAKITYTYKGIVYVKDLSDVGLLATKPFYLYQSETLEEVFYLGFSFGTNEWIIVNDDLESDTIAASSDFINWTGKNGYTNISVSIITLPNPCITVVLDDIEYRLQSVSQEAGKSIYYLINEDSIIISISFDTDRWTLRINDNIKYELVSIVNEPISTSWVLVEGTPFNTVSTINCNCEGFIVSIKECPGCWEIEETFTPVNPRTVTIENIYTSCQECEPPPPIPEVIVYPKRKVKPGYSTPSCDIEKYEKITCRSSEIYYKQVIRLRYGISNCCPEDEEKWLIKKELIDLDALRDPDYICRPITSCCNQPINDCGCHTLKTCNSQ
jgi:hypothetical protein